MATVNERLGTLTCPLCRKAKAVIRRNGAGTVTIACSGDNGCDFSGFGKAGTAAARLLAADVAAAPAAPSPPPSPPKKSGGFDLASLR